METRETPGERRGGPIEQWRTALLGAGVEGKR